MSEERKFDEAAFDKAVAKPNGWSKVADPVAEIRKMRDGDEAFGKDVLRTALSLVRAHFEGADDVFLEKSRELAAILDESGRGALASFVRAQTGDEPSWVPMERKPQAAPDTFAAKWLYRLEYHDGTCGLWYDGSGNWCFERGIGSLDDSCKTKSLPMDYDERYRQDGRSWFSSCSRKEDLLHWYSREDAKRLLSHGFVFTRYLATEYREYDQQTVFIKETCLYREEIDFESLWKSSSPGNAAALREALNILEKLDYAIPYVYQNRSPQNELARLVRMAENKVREVLKGE